MADEQAKSGRKPRVSDKDLLDVFRSTTDPVLSTAEVSECVPIKRRGTLRRLRTLENNDQLESKQIGGRNTVWWLSDSQEGHSTAVERSKPVADASPEPTPEATENEPRTVETDATSNDGLKDELRSIIPGSGPIVDERVNAVLTMYDHLRDNQGDIVRTGELKELVEGHNHGYKNTDGFWNNAVKKNAAQDRPNSLTSLPGVEELGNGRYQYTGE